MDEQAAGHSKSRWLEQGEEYRQRGFVAETFPLDDPGIIPALLHDAPGFERMVKANQAAGRHRVPYAVTDAITEVAHDPNITGLIDAILGSEQRWVMWGSNIQTGTPNQAGTWHVDIESYRWPTITVAIGLDGCTPGNSTKCIPYSHGLDRAPAILANKSDTAEALATASGFDPRCCDTVAPSGFADGRFYVFNAKCWHSGEVTASADRVMLFLHYQDAAAPRIPLLADYSQKLWEHSASPYIDGPDTPGTSPAVNREVAPPPRSRRQELRRLTRRFTDRSGAVAR